MSVLHRSRYLAPALVVALLWAATGPASAAETRSRTFSKSFPATRTEPLRLANLVGAVKLVPGTGEQVAVRVTVHAAGEDDAETESLLASLEWSRGRDRKGERWELTYPVDRYRTLRYPALEADGGGLLGWLTSSTSTVRYRGERVRVVGSRSGSAPILYADLEISMPTGSSLEVIDGVGAVTGHDLEGTLGLDTSSGEIEIASFVGPLAVDTGSGDVTVRDLHGDADIDTGSGDVRLVDVASDKIVVDTGSGDVRVESGRAARLDLDTGSGDVDVVEVELEELRADTGSGDVTVRGSLAGALRIVADTGSGDVVLRGGPDASFDAELDAGSGDVEVGYRDAELRRDGHEIVGARRGDGRTRISVDTGSGDIAIAPGS